MSKAGQVRRLIVCADGTGNAFASQESNVWRLYQALDLSEPDQVAHYIKGVGTSGFKPFAVFDAATGVGVPSNVRRLYEFLCWNWEPGVDIYLFGFSRGSFTARTLVGMMKHQGLMPRAFGREPVSRAEMKRNVMKAWRAYRSETVPRGKVWPTVGLARVLRDAVLALVARIRCDRPFREVEAERDEAKRRQIPIKFLGLFDTVEAFGVPIAELRTAIDHAIWPLSFRNHKLSAQVEQARHALSLDDERITFHPIRIEHEDGNRTIREVWFCGVHSDVGGGYPEGRLSLVPLTWMLDEVLAVGGANGLRFRAEPLAAIRDGASALAPRHDSRTGTAALYRYAPRHPHAEAIKYGGRPIVHHSVVEKMYFGTENYAPVTLPADARILMPDGSIEPVSDTKQRLVAADDPPKSRAEEALRGIGPPSHTYASLTLDNVWWGRLGYFAMLIMVLMVAFLPLTTPLVAEAFGHLFGSVESGQAVRGAVLVFEQGVGSNLDGLFAALGGVIPAYAKSLASAVAAHPFYALIILAPTLLLYAANQAQSAHLADLSRCVWFIKATNPHAKAPQTFFSKMGRRLRVSAPVNRLATTFSRGIAPSALLLLTVGGVVLLLNHAIVTYSAGAGILCGRTTPEVRLVTPKLGRAITAATEFRPNDPCWPSGIEVEAGQTYDLWFNVTESFEDERQAHPLEGFVAPRWSAYTLLSPLRRWWAADWLQPIARIGSSGSAEWPLSFVDGRTAMPIGDVQKQSSESTKAKQAVVEFTAASTGELYLFVNDAIVGWSPWFYRRNQGSARITVAAKPEPVLPEAAPPSGGTVDGNVEG